VKTGASLPHFGALARNRAKKCPFVQDPSNDFCKKQEYFPHHPFSSCIFYDILITESPKKGGTMDFSVCCFTGHRVLSASVRSALTEILDRRLAALVAVGFTEFRTGGALGFATLAASRVIELKKTHPQCRLHLMLPCRDQDLYWSAAERAAFAEILRHADEVTYLRDSYTPDCMHARNRALVEGSDLCLAYLKGGRRGGGTLYTCTYALKQDVRLINLADELPE
jgi:uncharacterized phage-like protein YoqJ